MKQPVRLIFAMAAVIGAVMGIRYARRDLNEPVDTTGAGLPLSADDGARSRVADSRVVARQGEPEWVTDLAGWVPHAPTGVARILAIIWALPVTIPGLLAGLMSGTRPRVRDGVVLFAPVRGPVAAALKRGGFAATTVGHVVLSLQEPSTSLMAHELVHTRQAERFGPFMGPTYYYLLARYGYTRHPMERAARVAGRRATHAGGGHTRPTKVPVRR